jgi:glutamyl-Q tRNA(Asp) synthetase
MRHYRGRFAPSPTGDLHAGSLLAALGSWLSARHAGGEWHVRIEDIDTPREVPGAADRQLNTLHAFGLVPDGGVLRQSARGEAYRAALDSLLADGRAFPCWCSRAELAAAGGVHRGCVHDRIEGRMPAIRLRVADGTVVGFDDGIHGAFEHRIDTEVGDFVLFRADGLWAYQLAVVVDDAELGVTDIVRGGDLLDSTPRQILLQRALGLPTPRYAHLPLVLGPDGRKLSKSDAAWPIDPADPLPALRRAWSQLGQRMDPAPRARSLTEWLGAAIAAFDPTHIPAGEIRHTPAADRA